MGNVFRYLLPLVPLIVLAYMASQVMRPREIKWGGTIGGLSVTKRECFSPVPFSPNWSHLSLESSNGEREVIFNSRPRSTLGEPGDYVLLTSSDGNSVKYESNRTSFWNKDEMVRDTTRLEDTLTFENPFGPSTEPIALSPTTDVFYSSMVTHNVFSRPTDLYVPQDNSTGLKFIVKQ
ncbi:MAG: hypothetical protein JSW08_01465 [archaeon]|nr:MAG: hypothetical protein JSW08_01465 [archaeon]